MEVAFFGVLSWTDIASRFLDSHLRIEDAGIRLDDRDGAVVGLQSVESGLGIDNGSQVQSQILRVHVRLEAVGQALLLAGRNLDGILGRGQVADDARG